MKYDINDEAYILGFLEAYSADADYSHNPYEKDTQLFNDWIIGYEDAMNTIYLAEI